tara:strand:- start:312 stop:1007 length:696 start_codon:yes stop_codon:yes gene_type:complete
MSFFNNIRSTWNQQFPHGFFVTKSAESMLKSSSKRELSLFQVLPQTMIGEGSTTTVTTTTDSKGETKSITTVVKNEKYMGAVFIGALWSVTNQVELHKANVKSIVTVVEDLGPFADTYIAATSRLKSSLGIEVSRLGWKDTSEQEVAEGDLEAVVKYIHEARKCGAVLVHCVAGKSRSATIMLAYLMSFTGKGLDECYRELKTAREEVEVNEHFMTELERLESEGFFKGRV